MTNYALIDMNSLGVASIMAHTKGSPIYDENIIRHIIINQLRLIKTKTKAELVLCYDGANNWRKQKFQYYKQNRKVLRESSSVDWNNMFKVLDKIREELAQNFPYKVLHVDTAEADDIIAVICKNITDPIVIVSSDEDFLQLQRYTNVSQYSLIKKAILKSMEPEKDLFEHILRGDPTDGIPNYLSDDDCMINESKRQTPLRQKLIDSLWQDKLDGIPFFDAPDRFKNFHRNKELIDFTKIPQNIQKEILDKYNSTKPADKSKIMHYLASNGMNVLLEHITEF